MIVKEVVEINGKQFDRTYSDGGYYIERDGARYVEAVDPLGSGREYVETDEPIIETKEFESEI